MKLDAKQLSDLAKHLGVASVDEVDEVDGVDGLFTDTGTH